MVLVAIRPNFELHVDRKVLGSDLVSISIKSRWPLARTDKSLHELLQLNLSVEDVDRLAAAIRGL